MTTFILIFFILFPFQEFTEMPPSPLAALVLKMDKYNRKSHNRFQVIYSESAKEKANHVSKLIKCSMHSVDDDLTTEDYTTSILLDLSNLQIESLYKKNPNILTVSNSETNISMVSVYIGIKENNRPIILINKERIQKEANFNSQFLKITTVWKN